MDLGTAVIDGFTHFALEFMENINKTSGTSMKEFVSSLCSVVFLA